MQLIRQPNRWSCLAASAAMLLQITVDDVIRGIGHDGSQKLWPHLPEPRCYKGFHIQEIVDLCHDHDYQLITVESQPVLLGKEGELPVHLFDREREESRIIEYMTSTPGILIGEISGGRYHACAWDGYRVYDPAGFIYNIDASEPEFNDSGYELSPIAVAEFLYIV